MFTEEKSVNNQLAAAEATLIQLQTQAHDLETEYQHDIDGMSYAITDLKSRGEELRQRCADQINVKQ